MLWVLWKTIWNLKKQKYNPYSHSTFIYLPPKIESRECKRYGCMYVLDSITGNIQKVEANYMSRDEWLNKVLCIQAMEHYLFKAKMKEILMHVFITEMNLMEYMLKGGILPLT